MFLPSFECLTDPYDAKDKFTEFGKVHIYRDPLSSEIFRYSVQEWLTYLLP